MLRQPGERAGEARASLKTAWRHKGSFTQEAFCVPGTVLDAGTEPETGLTGAFRHVAHTSLCFTRFVVHVSLLCLCSCVGERQEGAGRQRAVSFSRYVVAAVPGLSQA